MDSLYRDNILDHFKNPRNFGRLKQPDVSYQLSNPFCGDRIEVEANVKYQNSNVKCIKDIKFYGEGCAISMASASMLTDEVKGMSVWKVNKLTTNDILTLLGVKLTPVRLKCALLPLEVLQRALTLERK